MNISDHGIRKLVTLPMVMVRSPRIFFLAPFLVLLMTTFLFCKLMYNNYFLYKSILFVCLVLEECV